MELDWVKDMRFGTNSLVIERTGTRAEAEAFVRTTWQQIAGWVSKSGLKAAEVRFSVTEEPITIWASLTEMVERSVGTVRGKLFTAPTIEVWTPELIAAFKEFADSDKPSGMVDLRTEQQIWVNDKAEEMLRIAGTDAIKLNMRDFWHQEDLDRLSQRVNEVNDGGRFVFDYKCKLASSPSGWASFENEYRIVNGLYRLGITRRQPEPIAAPALV
jgi:PAS domain-containing protein